MKHKTNLLRKFVSFGSDADARTRQTANAEADKMAELVEGYINAGGKTTVDEIEKLLKERVVSAIAQDWIEELIEKGYFERVGENSIRETEKWNELKEAY
jgi:hypothetical protein